MIFHQDKRHHLNATGLKSGKKSINWVLIFCVNFEWHVCTYITTSIKCYLHSLRYVYVPFRRSLIFNANQTGMYIYFNLFLNVNKPSTKYSYLQRNFLACKGSSV